MMERLPCTTPEQQRLVGGLAHDNGVTGIVAALERTTMSARFDSQSMILLPVCPIGRRSP
jgi:hypothetical protein